MLWDEENRLQAVHNDDGTIDFADDNAAKFKYDDASQRIVRYDGKDGFENVYPNQFFTVRDRDIVFKHIFAGGTRIVSKRGYYESDPPANQCDLTAWGWETGIGSGLCQPIENSNSISEDEQYFYHQDHLGSSSYMTNVDGLAYQHLEYFPFGEIWVQEYETILGTEYYFSGKEFDNDTQLSYFGARYYDPRTSVWQSPDPILARYMRGEINNGVLAPQNLSLFSYSFQRPVVLVEPDGQAPLSRDRFMEITGISNPADAGRAFERVMLRSLTGMARANTRRYPSTERFRRTGGSFRRVQPDALTVTTGVNTELSNGRVDGFRGLDIDTNDGWVEIADFTEIKAVGRTTLPLSYNSFQLAGMIDALASGETQAERRDRIGPKPTLLIITTSDTRIGRSLQRYADGRGVALLHAWAQEDDDNPGQVYVGGTYNASPRTVKWSGKTGQRAKMYPTLKTGYRNDEETQFFRQVQSYCGARSAAR